MVDANKAFPAHKIGGKRCDCIVFFMNAAEDRLVTVPIELKGGSVDASEVFEQLQQGASFMKLWPIASYRETTTLSVLRF